MYSNFCVLTYQQLVADIVDIRYLVDANKKADNEI
jgi:hypothetical protein